MVFLLALIPATALTVAGYVALFLSHRSEGALRAFGRYLGIWAFVLAGCVVLAGMFAAGHMRRAHPGMWGPPPPGMDRHWMDRRRDGEARPPPGPLPAPARAEPQPTVPGTGGAAAAPPPPAH
jgi:hypothetical protein